MGKHNWQLLGRLRSAVQKITFLLNFNVNRWRLASIIGASSGNRRLSFNDRPGLRAACADDLDSDRSPGSSRAGRALSRTSSCPSPEIDIDKRAEMFIANFYKQLKMERQVSLQLRYCRGNSFDSVTSP